jgi:hypothetical protein
MRAPATASQRRSEGGSWGPLVPIPNASVRHSRTNFLRGILLAPPKRQKHSFAAPSLCQAAQLAALEADAPSFAQG